MNSLHRFPTFNLKKKKKKKGAKLSISLQEWTPAALPGWSALPIVI